MTEQKVVLEISNATNTDFSNIRVELTPTPSKKSKQSRLLTPQRLKESPPQPQVLFGSNGESNNDNDGEDDSGGNSTLSAAAAEEETLELNVGTDNLFDNNTLSSEGTTTATDALLLQQTNNSPPLSPLTTDDKTTITKEPIKEDTSSSTAEETTTPTEEETTLPEDETTTPSETETTTPSETETITPSETETTLYTEEESTTSSEEDEKKLSSAIGASIFSYISCFMLNAAMKVKDFFWVIVSACRWLWSMLISIGKAYAPWLVSAKDLLVAVVSFKFLSDTKDLPAVEASSFYPLSPVVEWVEEGVRGESGDVQFLLSFFVYVIVLFAGVPLVVFVFLLKLVAAIVYSSFFLFVGVPVAGLSSKDFFPFAEKVGKILLSVGKLLMLVTSVIGFIYIVFKTLGGLFGFLIGLPGGYLLGILVLEHVGHRGSKEFQWIPDRATSATDLACLLSDAKDLAIAAWLLFECLRNGWCCAKTGIRGIRDTTTAYIGGNSQHEDLDEEMPSLVKNVTLGIGLIYARVTTSVTKFGSSVKTNTPWILSGAKDLVWPIVTTSATKFVVSVGYSFAFAKKVFHLVCYVLDAICYVLAGIIWCLCLVLVKDWMLRYFQDNMIITFIIMFLSVILLSLSVTVIVKALGEKLTFYRAVELKHAGAYNNVGCAYFNGDGVEMDKKIAVHYWHQAAELGNAGAYFNIGTAYDKGRGVEVDKKKAIHYWELAAASGNAKAKRKLDAAAAE